MIYIYFSFFRNDQCSRFNIITRKMLLKTLFVFLLLIYSSAVSATLKNPIKLRFQCFLPDDRINNLTNISTKDFRWFFNGHVLDDVLLSKKNLSITFLNSSSVLELSLWNYSTIYMGNYMCHNAVQGLYQFNLTG